MVLATCFWLSCSAPETPPELPPGIVGTWRTGDPRFEGRFLELRPVAIRFGTGQPGAVAYPVTSVDERLESTGSRLTVGYSPAPETKHFLTLIWRKAEGVLELENRPGIEWRRLDDGP